MRVGLLIPQSKRRLRSGKWVVVQPHKRTVEMTSGPKIRILRSFKMGKNTRPLHSNNVFTKSLYFGSTTTTPYGLKSKSFRQDYLPTVKRKPT